LGVREIIGAVLTPISQAMFFESFEIHIDMLAAYG
jgi:hypothetical protein